MVQNIMTVNQLQLVSKTIEGVQAILVECWKKYNYPELDDRDKISYLKLAKDCNKAREEMDNFETTDLSWKWK